MGNEERVGDGQAKGGPVHRVKEGRRFQLRKFLKGCRPDWSRQSIGTVLEKLSKVGVYAIADLQESIRLGTLNSSLEQVGEKRFNTETLELLRQGPQVLQPMYDVDDDYHDFPEPLYFRVKVRCVASQSSQRLDGRKTMARVRGEVVQAMGRAGSWLRLTPLEAILDGDKGEDPVWLQISNLIREDGRVAQEAETACLLLRGIYPEALDPLAESGNGAETKGWHSFCSAIEELKDVFAAALHTQGIVKRCSNTRPPPLDDTAFDPRRLASCFSATIISPGTGRLQARQGRGGRVNGLGQWRVFADRDYEPGEVLEQCPLLRASCEASYGSVLDRRMVAIDTAEGVQRSLPLGFGCLYRRATDATEAEANVRMEVCPDLEMAVVCSTRRVHAGEELLLPLSSLRPGRRRQPLAESQDDVRWLPSRLGLTAGAARLGQSKIHGRGVFAATDLAENDVVELCPGLALDEGSQGPFQDFAMLFYEHPLSDREAAKAISVIALGHGAMYNHKNPGYNLEWGWIEGLSMIEMRATRDIEEGEELFISYGSNYWKGRDKKPG